MAKVIFEADDNQKGIIDKLFVRNDQVVKNGDKIAIVITKDKNYEIVAPSSGMIKNILVYENKVISSGDILLEVSTESMSQIQQDFNSTPKMYNNSRLNSTQSESVEQEPLKKYNGISNSRFAEKKSETEIFREELIGTLLSREVSGELQETSFNDTVNLDQIIIDQQKSPQQTKIDKTDLFKDNISTTAYLLDDKVDSLENKNTLSELENGINNSKLNLLNAQDPSNLEKIQEEMISEIANLEHSKSKDVVSIDHSDHDALSNTMIHEIYADIQVDLNHESNIDDLVTDDFGNETIYFDEELAQNDFVVNESIDKNESELPIEKDPFTLNNPELESNEARSDLLNEEHFNRDKNSSSIKNQFHGNKNEQESDEIKLNEKAIRRAEEIINCKSIIAHSFIDVEVDVSELVNLLSIMREPYAQNEMELTLYPFYIKAVHTGLKKFPLFNASYQRDTNSLLFKWFYNLAISVDAETGVKMPVIKDIKNESIKEIAFRLTHLINQAVNNELDREDYNDSSFTIVNYGDYGITKGTLTIPTNNVGAIGMGIIFKKPVVVEKNDIVIRDIMIITLGYDEAVIDLSEASKFVHYVAYLLSNPGLLL